MELYDVLLEFLFSSSCWLMLILYARNQGQKFDIYTSVIPLQVPIVASTGGLVDTVEEGFTGFQMGSFSVDVIYSSPSYNSRVIPSIPLDSTVISVFIIDQFLSV